MLIGIEARHAFKRKRGGIGTYVDNIIHWLPQIDIDSRYIMYTDGDTHSDQELVRTNVSFRRLSFPLEGLWKFTRLQASLLRQRPDVFLFTANSMPIWCGCKSVVVIYDLNYLHQSFGKLYTVKTDFLRRRAAKASNHIITISENSKSDILGEYEVSSDKISVIPLAYDKGLFHPNYDSDLVARVKEKYKIEKNYILWVGAISPHKNVVRLVKAYGILKQQNSIDHTLVIAGMKGGAYKEVLRTVESFGLENDVTFLDYISLSDLPSVYSGASVFVFPSLYEGFGLPVLEAMACGCPVVASNVASIPDVAGNAALLFDPNNVDEMASSIHKILTDDQLRDTLVSQGFKHVKNFSWERTAYQTLEVLRMVSDGHS